MRLRKVKNADEILQKNSDIVILDNDRNFQLDWKKIFKNDNEIRLEIGMGKGDFIIQMAQKYPKINFIGIEKFDSVIVRAVEKITKLEIIPPNLKLLKIDAEDIEKYFIPDTVGAIYLNFSDPWPKERHAKRRLTHKKFLEKYKIILKNRAYIYQKTDNMSLFEFSLESFSNFGFKLKNISLDLHNSDYEIPPMTEFEKKFIEQGMKIYRVETLVNK